MSRYLDRGLTCLERACMGMAIGAMFLMMVSISVDAAGRYFFNQPISGLFEVTEIYLLVIANYCAFPRLHALGGNISLDIIGERLKKVPFHLPARLAALIATLAFGIATYATSLEAANRIARRLTTVGEIQLPTYLSYVWVPVGFGLLALRLAFDIFWPPAVRAKNRAQAAPAGSGA